MPPKRPPPLPKSLFTSQAQQAAPQPTNKPSFITDAHNFGIFLHNDDPAVTGSITIAIDNNPVALPAIAPTAETPRPFYKTVRGHVLPQDLASLSKPGASLGTVDLILPTPDWEVAHQAIKAIDSASTPTVLVSGLLPPPLQLQSGPLLQSEGYASYSGRLGELSLSSNVVIKALPPVLPDWEEDELERVVKMYLAPAIETFGTHRIVFGSCPALPSEGAMSGIRWYALLRKCLTDLGIDDDGMTQIFGSNARKSYETPA